MTPTTNIKRHMRSHGWLGVAALAATCLAGCLTPFRAPPDVAHLRLSAVDSATVLVHKVWLERRAGEPLVVAGYVMRRIAAEDTTRTHLQIVILDAAGAVLRTDTAAFEPRQIPPPTPRFRTATYRHPLDPLPATAAEISVRAVDDIDAPR